jgi:hypothetical protein
LRGAKIEAILSYEPNHPYEFFCFHSFRESVGWIVTDQNGRFDFKLPLDSTVSDFNYQLKITKDSFFDKQIDLSARIGLDSSYVLALYQRRKTLLSIRYTNQLADTVGCVIGYGYHVTPDSHFKLDQSPFPMTDDFIPGNRYYVYADQLFFGTDYAITTPCLLTIDCYVMHEKTKQKRFLVADTLEVPRTDVLSRVYQLKPKQPIPMKRGRIIDTASLSKLKSVIISAGL